MKTIIKLAFNVQNNIGKAQIIKKIACSVKMSKRKFIALLYCYFLIAVSLHDESLYVSVLYSLLPYNKSFRCKFLLSISISKFSSKPVFLGRTKTKLLAFVSFRLTSVSKTPLFTKKNTIHQKKKN